jgi:hypothetical protein
MVDLDQLKGSGRRAYELARLRMASRVALYLVPIAVISMWAAADRETCGCLAVLLLLVSIGARYRSGAGIREVRAGLYAGTAVLLLAWGLAWAGWLAAPWAGAPLALVGFVAAWLTCRGPRLAWMGMLVASLMAGLGCVDLGPATAGVVAGLVLGATCARATEIVRLRRGKGEPRSE